MRKIPVVLQHGRGFVYDVDDYSELRSTHRITGSLIGVPVSKSRNVNLSALPAVLSQYELNLGLEKNLIVLLNKATSLLLSPKSEDETSFRNLTKKQTSEQRAPYIEKRLLEFEKILPQIIEGKRKKLMKNGAKEKDIRVDPITVISEERQKLETGAFTPLVQIPMEHPIPTEFSIVHLTAEDRIKYKVFKDIWEKQKMYVSGGDTFGCDFLLYPGDPLYYHASHVVHVLKDSKLRLDFKYLTRCCRLSVVVNKICIVAYENSLGTICYQTMEWEGNAISIM
ncbi:tRNA-splicing endonuclease subunit Sen34 [Sabethes cyaneus]|uniref:tRNA-splicing endonuclease subunit Sen34 n=1 Tax=Sabethes cyaneus TaxID=53552 RepID=UPI00237D4601|nr:tRNA-splicing endonuclease subunit Sen34 [Sabethes cyaneus]